MTDLIEAREAASAFLATDPPVSLARALLSHGFIQRSPLASDYDFLCQDDGGGEYLAEWASAKPFPDLCGGASAYPLTVDTPKAAELVNAAPEGPREYPESIDLEALATENERLKAENEELKAKLAEAEIPQSLPPDPATKLSDYIPAEISALMEPGETFTAARKRLSELLNVEKAELRLKRAAGSATDEDLKREADVDRLQGLFSKLGEI